VMPGLKESRHGDKMTVSLVSHASVLSGRHSNTREVRTIEEVTALVRILYDRQLQCPRLWYPLENAAAQPCLVSSVDVGK
jgi:hypothetical protein